MHARSGTAIDLVHVCGSSNNPHECTDSVSMPLPLALNLPLDLMFSVARVLLSALTQYGLLVPVRLFVNQRVKSGALLTCGFSMVAQNVA